MISGDKSIFDITGTAIKRYLYVTSTCTKCIPLKQYIEEKNLPIEVKTVDEDAEALGDFQFYSQYFDVPLQTVPVLVLDSGDEVLHMIDTDEIWKYLCHTEGVNSCLQSFQL